MCREKTVEKVGRMCWESGIQVREELRLILMSSAAGVSQVPRPDPTGQMQYSDAESSFTIALSLALQVDS